MHSKTSLHIPKKYPVTREPLSLGLQHSISLGNDVHVVPPKSLTLKFWFISFSWLSLGLKRRIFFLTETLLHTGCARGKRRLISSWLFVLYLLKRNTFPFKVQFIYYISIGFQGPNVQYFPYKVFSIHYGSR